MEKEFYIKLRIITIGEDIIRIVAQFFKSIF